MTALLKYLPENVFPKDKLCSEFNAFILFIMGQKVRISIYFSKRFGEASLHSHLNQ